MHDPSSAGTSLMPGMQRASPAFPRYSKRPVDRRELQLTPSNLLAEQLRSLLGRLTQNSLWDLKIGGDFFPDAFVSSQYGLVGQFFEAHRNSRLSNQNLLPPERQTLALLNELKYRAGEPWAAKRRGTMRPTADSV
jgi:hypothetical protein